MNVAFYLPNKRTRDVDCKDLDKGNPGIGGTFYAMLFLAYKLSCNKVNDKEIYVFAESVSNLPSSLNSIKVSDITSVVDNIRKYHIDILVVNNGSKDTLSENFWYHINGVTVDIVLWTHCFVSLSDLNYYNRNSQIKRIVCVGKEQLYTYFDHPAFCKSTYIYNLCDLEERVQEKYIDRENAVVYVGSILPIKGLHYLTDVWPKIKKAIPNAQLYVIGGGNLYDRDAKLGSYNITESFYEKRILRNLLDSNGRIDPSVHFLGVMGDEKYDILTKSKVGIPNPGGKSETFGYTAVEMQLAGMMITTKKCPGYLDTVMPSAGCLYENTTDLAQNILNLLSCKDYDPHLAIDQIKTKFETDKIISKWRCLFNDVYYNRKEDNELFRSLLKFNRYVYVNSRCRKVIPFLPPLLLYREYMEKISYYFSKLIELPLTIQKMKYRFNKKKCC